LFWILHCPALNFFHFCFCDHFPGQHGLALPLGLDAWVAIVLRAGTNQNFQCMYCGQHFLMKPEVCSHTQTLKANVQNLTERSFLNWANDSGMGLDDQYPGSAVLSFKSDLQQDRFWEIPSNPEQRPYFVGSILSLLGNWNTCYVWRHLGSWPDSADPNRINDQIELQILRGIGLPLGTADAVAFSRDEINQLGTLIFSTIPSANSKGLN
jgi:hypothetical protein